MSLGVALGKSRGAVESYESGITPMSVAEKRIIAHRYDIPLELLGIGPDSVAGATGQPDPSLALAKYVLKTSDDPAARELALAVVEVRLAQKV